MERKIGETFDCNGVKLCVKEDIDCCIGCFFYENNISCSSCHGDIGECDRIGRTDGKSVIFEEVKNMEERIIKLTLEKAKEFYKKGGEFRNLALSAYTEEELIYLPKTWREFCELHNKQLPYEYFIDSHSNITQVAIGYERKADINRNILPSKEAAEAHLALMQLHQLRDYYRQGWIPDWNTDEYAKYCIVRDYDDYQIVTMYRTSTFLSFQSLEVAQELLNNFKDLIIKAGDLL